MLSFARVAACLALGASCGRVGFERGEPATGGDSIATDAYSAEVLADGPVAYWRLADAGGTVARDEMGTYPGTYEGSCQLGVAGILAGGNPAVRFDGSSCRVVIGEVLPFAGAAPFTLELWMEPDTVDGLVRWAIDREVLSGQRSGYQIAYQNIELFFQRYIADASVTYLGAGSAPAVGRFQLFTVTFDGTTERMFVDGALVNTGTFTASPPADPGVLVLGDNARNNLGKFSGVLDEVAIYDYALPEARVTAHFAAR